ncbi:c-type cytochrome [Dinoroseobacter sp. S76]|uniref:c-type cytochrome n=1 Tax=Dinoroseobacter sp. S76 TaxID=3415124 RepID=UPI003C7E45CD
MSITRSFALALVGAAAFATMTPSLAVAQSYENQLKARQGQFRLIALNIGVLGGMARGNVPYDAEMAQAAADNLVAVASLHQGAMWPEGSDSMSIDGTRAMPSIWEDNADFLSKWGDVATAAAGIAAVASDGQAALGPALGPLGATCKACHEAHRAPES